jgi:hypothetical protein
MRCMALSWQSMNQWMKIIQGVCIQGKGRIVKLPKNPETPQIFFNKEYPVSSVCEIHMRGV